MIWVNLSATKTPCGEPQTVNGTFECVEKCRRLVYVSNSHAKNMSAPGNIYLLRDTNLLTGAVSNYLKIGKTVNPTPSRVSGLQTGNPRRISPVNSFFVPMMTDMETYLHHWFSSDRILGEWFDIDDTRMTTEVIPKINQLMREQTDFISNLAIIEPLNQSYDNGTVRNPTAGEQTLSDELKSAREALKIAKAQHKIDDCNLRAAIGSSNGIVDIVTLIEKAQSPSFDRAAFIASLTAAQSALCHNSGVEFSSKATFQNRGDSLTTLDPALQTALNSANASDPTPLPLTNATNPVLARDPALETLHRNWLGSRRDVAEQNWIIKQKEAELKVSIGQDREITGVMRWIREDVTFTDKFSLSDAKANLSTQMSAFETPRPNNLAVEINECRPYP
jgi:hypothetical protein